MNLWSCDLLRWQECFSTLFAEKDFQRFLWQNTFSNNLFAEALLDGLGEKNKKFWRTKNGRNQGNVQHRKDLELKKSDGERPKRADLDCRNGSKTTCSRLKSLSGMCLAQIHQVDVEDFTEPKEFAEAIKRLIYWTRQDFRILILSQQFWQLQEKDNLNFFSSTWQVKRSQLKIKNKKCRDRPNKVESKRTDKTRSHECAFGTKQKKSLVGKLLVKRDTTLLKRVQSEGRNIKKSIRKRFWLRPTKRSMNLYLKNKKMTHYRCLHKLRNKRSVETWVQCMS